MIANDWCYGFGAFRSSTDRYLKILTAPLALVVRAWS